MDQFSQFIKPEPLILISILNLVGWAIKVSPVKDRLIPFILGGFGIALSV